MLHGRPLVEAQKVCLGIPGKVVRWLEREGPFAQAEVEFDGLRRLCHMACVLDADEGDYVIVHAGVAISRLDPQEAQRVFEALAQLGDDEGWIRQDGVQGSEEQGPVNLNPEPWNLTDEIR